MLGCAGSPRLARFRGETLNLAFFGGGPKACRCHVEGLLLLLGHERWKSTVLLQSSYNYHERGMRTMLFMPALDTRAGYGRIQSRIGLASDAIALQSVDDLLKRVGDSHAEEPVSCVLIDEAQFLTPAQVRQVTDIADTLRIPVLCYGLRTDFQGKLFPGSARASGPRRQPDRAEDDLPLRPQGDDEPASRSRREGRERGRAGRDRRQRQVHRDVPAPFQGGVCRRRTGAAKG